jgi:PilZ domain-containing protein
VSAVPFSTPRRFERIPVNIPITLVRNATGNKTKHPAYMIDISEHEVRLKAKVPVSAGENLDVLPAEGARFAARSRVVWVGEPRTNLESDLGLEFLRPFPLASWNVTEGPKRKKH